MKINDHDFSFCAADLLRLCCVNADARLLLWMFYLSFFFFIRLLE